MTGDELSNGAIELMRKSTKDGNIDIVLALFGHQFVTWIYNKKKEMFLIGNYHDDDLQGALDDFNERE